jgi:S-adenosylmethionine hydrolase
MRDQLLTLTTDFGTGSCAVAVMKGVLLSINPALRLVDVSHGIPPQDIHHAAFVLAEALPYFPSGTIHVIVVDPGVGTDRALLHVEAGSQQLLAPDNGCWNLVAERLTDSPRVRRLAEPRFWRHPVSNTFHGRDILAPVAAQLSLGLQVAELGPVVTSWVRLVKPVLKLAEDRLAGEITLVDPFGNLQTSIPADVFQRLARGGVRVRVGPHEIPRVVRAYGDAQPGEVVALVSSSDCLEIAIVQGNAGRVLGVAAGTPVEVIARTDQP